MKHRGHRGASRISLARNQFCATVITTMENTTKLPTLTPAVISQVMSHVRRQASPASQRRSKAACRRAQRAQVAARLAKKNTL